MSLHSAGPGKFEGGYAINEKVYGLSLDTSYLESDLGDSEGFGRYGLVTYDVEQLLQVEPDFADITKDEIEFLASHPWAIVCEDNEGFVKVEYFETEEGARGRWKDIDTEYEEYCEV